MTTTFTNIFRAIPLLLIKFYQKFISPYKGFRCASNVLHKNGSCSGIIFNIIKEKPISQWKSNIKNQFDCCKKAHLTLKSQCNHKNNCNKEEKQEDIETNKSKRKNKDSLTFDCASDAVCCSIENGGVSCLRGLKPSSKKCDDCVPDFNCSECGVSSCL